MYLKLRFWFVILLVESVWHERNFKQPSDAKNTTQHVFMPPFDEIKNSQSTKEPLISMQSAHYSSALNFNTLRITDTWEWFIIRSAQNI